MAISDWSTTASSNGNSDANINWAEGQAPSTVNDSARSMMTRLKHWWNQLGGNITSGGSSNAYTLTSGESLSAYATGMRFLWKPNAAPTGAATMNVDGIGAKKLFMPDGTQVASGELDANSFYDIVYDASLDTAAGGFQIIGFEGESLTETHLLTTNNLSDVDSASTSLSNLGGQPLDATLTALAGLSVSSGDYIKATGTDTFTTDDLTGYAQLASANSFTQTQTITNTLPRLTFSETDASANEGNYTFDVSGGTFYLRAYDDAFSGASFPLVVSRSGTTISSIALNATAVTVSGSMTASSIIGPAPQVNSVSGTLVPATHANRSLRLNGNITLDSGWTEGDVVILDANGTARTVTRGTATGMFVNGSNVTSATVAARGVVGVRWAYTNVCYLTGDVS